MATLSFGSVRHGLPAPYARIALHAGLWVLYANYEHFLYSGWRETPLVTWSFALTTTLAAVAGYYFFSEVVLPRFVLRQRWLLSVLSLVAIYYGWALLSYGLFLLLESNNLISRTLNDYIYRILGKGVWMGVFSWYGVSIGIFDFAVNVMPPILVRFVQFLLTSGNRSLQLERENLNLEVNFLKAQVNPHFLFNTLNNIYTMVVKQDERAPDMVQHLSDLMHYTVYESDAPRVPLPQELGFLGAYLELERLRYGQKVTIAYQKSGPFEQYSITPLLFFPFVENAFKHGIDSSLDASWVRITLLVQDGQLHFEVNNSFAPTAPKRDVGGVGIANVRKRLALHYPTTDYQLTVQQTDEQYQVHLTLRLYPLGTAPPLARNANRPVAHPSGVLPIR
ncbi:histidine kinase [Hymenobacter tibetensis]|uniref:Histidine kinase n=1 Tax=Hymenobacter tibetensis TaxID=497967 RepID=A0ABY4D4R5_9BACT|nr:histidine kinase [Hymenobacter tibetensis]UOG76959.1 histidine kinase [Hymenobacter tibetensis]